MVGKEEVARDFQFLKGKVLAVLVFGSSTEGEGRDTDICIVAPDRLDIKEVFKRLMSLAKNTMCGSLKSCPYI